MLLKIVTLFLVFMVVMASIHRWIGRRAERRSIDLLRCPACKGIRTGTGPCRCGKEKKDR